VRRQRERAQGRLRECAREAVKAVFGRSLAELDDPRTVRALEDLAQFGPASSAAEPSPVERRLMFLKSDQPDGQAPYLGSGAGTWHAAQVVAYVTDFAPEWIYDCATRRR
jgi:hypothetical protein